MSRSRASCSSARTRPAALHAPDSIPARVDAGQRPGLRQLGRRAGGAERGGGALGGPRELPRAARSVRVADHCAAACPRAGWSATRAAAAARSGRGPPPGRPAPRRAGQRPGRRARRRPHVGVVRRAGRAAAARSGPAGGARARPPGGSGPRRSPRPSPPRAGRCRRTRTRPGARAWAGPPRPRSRPRRTRATPPGRPRGRRTGARRGRGPRAARRAPERQVHLAARGRPRSGSRIRATNSRRASVTPVRTPCPKAPSSGRAYSGTSRAMAARISSVAAPRAGSIASATEGGSSRQGSAWSSSCHSDEQNRDENTAAGSLGHIDTCS